MGHLCSFRYEILSASETALRIHLLQLSVNRQGGLFIIFLFTINL